MYDLMIGDGRQMGVRRPSDHCLRPDAELELLPTIRGEFTLLPDGGWRVDSPPGQA
jgi:hypothetical protein